MDGFPQSRESLDFSDQNLLNFPSIPKSSIIVQLNLRTNFLTTLPIMSKFTSLRSIDLSSNQFVDLSPLSVLKGLRELDCSHNQIVSLAFTAPLVNLTVLRAAYNRVTTIAAQMPDSLSECDISHNEFASVEFLQFKFSPALERLDISGNLIRDVVELRYLSVFPNLLVLNAGFVDAHRDLHLIPFVRYLCPALALFDGVDCSECEPPDEFPEPDQLYDVLVRGDDADLCDLIRRSEPSIAWAPPTFIAFREEELPADDGLAEAEEQLAELEGRLPLFEQEVPEPEPAFAPPNPAEIERMRAELAEMKAQLTEIVRLVYVHDQAVRAAYRRRRG
jgi:hypothetical protein